MTYYHSSFQRNRKKKNNPFKKFLIFFSVLVLLAVGAFGYLVYQAVFTPNVWTENNEKVYVYINTDDGLEEVKKELYSKGLIINRLYFEEVAKYKKYGENVKPGRYLISKGMTNNELINLLRLGEQEPVKLRFNNIRLKEDLAERIDGQINIDKAELLSLLNDSNYTKSLGFTTETIKCMFLPNTYFINWNTNTEQFLTRMKYEYDQFWTEERRTKAAHYDLTPTEVSILASIIDKETQQNTEKPRMAGVYLNRLKNGWRLQADPTLVYAMGDFKIKRVLNVYKKIDSPYNTYMYLGLPPGPICIPSLSSINAVLNAEEHSYYYFCAQPNYSGFHNFAKYSKQHIKNANIYREFLNKEGIYK